MRQLRRTPSPIAESLVAPSYGRGCTSLQPRSVAGAVLFQRSNLNRIVRRRRERRRRGRSAGNREAEGGLNHNGSGGGMRFVVLFLALFLVEPSHAQEAPNLAFVSEYIRELGVNERMRALGEREVTAVDANSRFPAIIRSSTRIQSELGAQIRTLSGIHLKPPFEDLTTKITKFYNMKIEFHQRLIAISTLLLSRPQPGVDYGALAAEAPKTTASLEYIDRSLFEATPLIFATLIDQTPDKNGKVSHLIITRAERQHLLVALSLHFGQKMDLENQSYIVSSASILKSYLLQYKCSDEP